MPTKAELKAKKQHVKLRIRTGDKVMIIAGKDKGQTGFVAAVSQEKMKAIILQDNEENPEQPLPLNAAVKHFKAKYQGQRSARVRIPVPIHISNLMVIDPESGQPSRIGRRKEDGKIVRFAKKSGKTILDEPNMQKEG